jgi:predicted XRE-type DNA-binding protein
MNKQIPITVHFGEETLKRIQEVSTYTSFSNYLNPSRNKPTDLDIEDFITACVNDKLDEIRNYIELVNYEEMGRQGKLRNRFKEFLDKTDLKQKDLSEITGIHKANISTFLSNQKQPSLESFIRIWIAFKCPPIHELIYKEDE